MPPDEITPVEVVPTPDAGLTANPNPEVLTPEDPPIEATKTFTQEELDAAISKRLSRERRKWDRENATNATPAQPPVNGTELNPADFADNDAYVDALADQRAQRIVEDRERKKQTSEVVEAYHTREEAAREKYDDFEQVAYNPKVPITEPMAEAIRASDIGPEVAYYLGSNVAEAARIAKLSPFVQAKEIGRIEATLASAPPVKKTSSAPAPIVPINSKSSGAPVIDTTDPRSIKSMDTSTWIENERKRQIRMLEGK